MKLLLATSDGLQTLADDGAADGRCIGVLPGDDIALHHVAGGADEARLLAIDLAARPAEELHIATAAGDDDGSQWLAIIDPALLRAHLARFRAAGIEPAHLLPAALLLPAGGATAPLGDKLLLRTDRLGACVEPALLPLLAGRDLRPLPEFRPELGESLPLDLLQGAFAPRFRWWAQRSFQIAAALLLALLVAAVLAPGLIADRRADALIRAQDSETVELAANALGETPESAAAAATALAAARQQAEGQALGPRLALAAAAVEHAPGARIDRLTLQADGSLDLRANGPADSINQLGDFLRAGPFAVEVEGTRLRLGGRRPPPEPASPALAATLRLQQARADAALLQSAATRPLPPEEAATRLTAGLDGSGVERQQGGLLVRVPAAKSTVLLPLLAALERQGARIAALDIERNPDESIAATVEFQ